MPAVPSLKLPTIKPAGERKDIEPQGDTKLVCIRDCPGQEFRSDAPAAEPTWHDDASDQEVPVKVADVEDGELRW